MQVRSMTRTTKALIAVGVILGLTFALVPFFTAWPGWLTEVGRRAEGIRSVALGGERVPLLVADTEAERTQGLSDRATTSPAAGMLFVFPGDGAYGIWMKDMRFALDIIWVSAEGVIVDIKENALPESFPEIFRPREAARYVIEVPAGYVERLKVRLGHVIGL